LGRFLYKYKQSQDFLAFCETVATATAGKARRTQSLSGLDFGRMVPQKNTKTTKRLF
jgi:hypothetical protein